MCITVSCMTMCLILFHIDCGVGEIYISLDSNRNRETGRCAEDNAIAHRSTSEGAKGREGVNGTRVRVYMYVCVRACDACMCVRARARVCMRARGCVSPSERKEVFINSKSIRSVYVL